MQAARAAAINEYRGVRWSYVFPLRAFCKHDLQMFSSVERPKPPYIHRNIFILVTDNILCPVKNTFAQTIRVRTEYLRGKYQVILPGLN